jgi:hypothetical protein
VLLNTRDFFAPCQRCSAGGPPGVPARELAVNYFDMDAPLGGGCCNVCRPAFEAIHRCGVRARQVLPLAGVCCLLGVSA